MEEAEILLRNAMEHHGAAVYRWPCAGCRASRTQRTCTRTCFSGCWARGICLDGEHLRAWLLRCTVNRCHDLHPFRCGGPVLALAGPAGDGRGSGQRRRRAVGRSGPPAGKAARPIHPVLCRGVFHGGDRGLLDIPAATVRNRLRRARKRLKGPAGRRTTMKKTTIQNLMEHIQPPAG